MTISILGFWWGITVSGIEGTVLFVLLALVSYAGLTFLNRGREER